MSVVMISQLSGVQANASEKICGNVLSLLNEGKHFEEFDKQNGGGEKRLRFRSAGRCAANECKVEVVAGAPAAEKVIATITGRISSYCVYGLNRAHIAWNRRQLGCPSSYLWNRLGIILAEDGRNVGISYMYGAEGGSVALSECISSGVVDGLFVREVWRVPLDDRSEVVISETVYLGKPGKPGRPFATSVGAKNR
jgi:hypothetical protein